MKSQAQPLTAQAERRLSTRIPVSERAILLLGHLGSAVQCTLIDLCLDGCQVRADADIRVERGAKVELVFRLCGEAFRLSGVTEWTGRARDVGVAFRDVSPRREADLVEALGELAEKLEAQRAEASHADEDLGAVRETVERLTAELEAKRAREGQARDGAEQAAREARQTQEKLESAKKSLAQAQKSAAQRARSVPAQTNQASLAETPAAISNKAATQRRERRQAQRHQVDSTATIFLVDVRSYVRGRIVDVSMSGCRIRSAERFPVGIYRRVEVEFLLDGLPFRLPGVVQSLHDRFTAGIRFVDLSERKQEQLSLVMEEIAEAAQEVERQAD